jgi:hypothetical protein
MPWKKYKAGCETSSRRPGYQNQEANILTSPILRAQRVPKKVATKPISPTASQKPYNMMALSQTQRKEWLSDGSQKFFDERRDELFMKQLKLKLESNTALLHQSPSKVSEYIQGTPGFKARMTRLKLEISAWADDFTTRSFLQNQSTEVGREEFIAIRLYTSKKGLNQMVMTCT